MNYIQSKEVLNKEGKQYHIACGKGDVGRYVLLPGDPFRTDQIAQYLDHPQLVAHNREHKTWTGRLDGVKVSVTSTGMGGSSAAIAVEELIHCGADTFLRIGTCGRVCEDSYEKTYKGLIVTGAVRDEGTTVQYVPLAYPAIADIGVTQALINAGKTYPGQFPHGIAHAKDSFYGQHDPLSMPASGVLNQNWEAWEKAHVMASEMESAALFVISSIRGVRAGALVAYEEMNEETMDVAMTALRQLIKDDTSHK